MHGDTGREIPWQVFRILLRSRKHTFRFTAHTLYTDRVSLCNLALGLLSITHFTGLGLQSALLPAAAQAGNATYSLASSPLGDRRTVEPIARYGIVRGAIICTAGVYARGLL